MTHRLYLDSDGDVHLLEEDEERAKCASTILGPPSAGLFAAVPAALWPQLDELIDQVADEAEFRLGCRAAAERRA